MNILDIVIILFFLTALLRGVELGVIRQIFSTIALLAGLFLGALVQGKLIHVVHTPTTKTLLSLITILVCISVVSSIGEFVGVAIKQSLERAQRLRILDVADKALGAAMAGATLLLAVWLGASIFNNAPVGGLQKQIKGSVIVAELNKSLPPTPNIVARLGHLIDPNGFPNVFTGLEPAINTNAPLPSIGELDPAVQADRASVVKIAGAGCGGVSEGSGFVAEDGLVITNAHVVAGVQNPYVLDGSGQHSAQVVYFDPNLDVAVLRANIHDKPLKMAASMANNGTASAILGYPGGGGFTANPATVLDSFNAVGRNIYNQGETQRSVYSIKGIVRPGNSGGPLIDKDGTVIGVVFAESTTYDNVGYALAMQSVINDFNQARTNTQTVSTGSCAE